MFKRIHQIIATAACGLTLALLSGPSAHAAANVVLSGKVDGNPRALVWVDTEKGSQLDAKAAKAIRSQYVGTEWTAMDDGQVVISKGGKALLGGAYITNDENTLFLFHNRVGNQIIDGHFYSYSDDPTKGFGQVYVTEIAADGHSSRTALISVDLEFSEEQ